jgi:hypothetical protein
MGHHAQYDRRDHLFETNPFGLFELHHFIELLYL